MDKPTRGRVRKVDLLPDSIRKPLLEMLREKRLTQVQIREEINRLIREAGLPEEQQLSPAAISREASRNELIARNLRDLREQTKAMMAELGDTRCNSSDCTYHRACTGDPVPCHREQYRLATFCAP